MAQRRNKSIIVAFGAAVLALALLEGLARLAGEPSHILNSTFVEAPEWDYPGQIARDPELFWRYRPLQVIYSGFFAPGTCTINSQGFRGPEPNETKPPDIRRVVCLGESTTFGWGVPDAVAYPRQLETQLNLLDPRRQRWEVINAGVTNYSTYQGVILAQRWLPRWKPDIVLFNYSWADHQPAGMGTPDNDVEMPARWRLEIEEVLRHSAAVQWATWAWLSLFHSEGSLRPADRRVWRVGLPEFVGNIEKLVRATQDVGARPVIVTSPISWPPPGKSDTSGIFHYHQRYRRMARYGAIASGAEFVELANAFDPHPEFFDDPRVDNEHFNAAGHAFAAEFLARFVLGTSQDTTDSSR
jgi:lysophospholipase L1-like esterase